MLDYKIIQYFKEKIKFKDNEIDQKEFELLVNYTFNDKKKIEINNIFKDILYLNILRFAIRRRILKEPISQIVGFRKFWNSIFYIDENVLDPRPDTELIVKKVLQLSGSHLSLLDLGTGSGCIAISIALERPGFEIFASDISLDALKIAKLNAKFCDASITFIKSNWFAKIDRSFDIIVANPPYISENEYENLALGIRRFEPKIALTSGYQGLESFHIIIKEFNEYLNPNGILLLEIGYNQKNTVKKLFNQQGYKKLNFFKDLSGRTRVVCVKKDA